LLGFLYLNERRFTLKTSAAEFTTALQHTRILSEFADTYRRPRFDPVDRLNASGYARDLYMAENVQWQVGELKPGTRMIIWAHNDHVGKFKGSLGDYLQQTYGSDYYALGFSFNQGSFQARELTPDVTIGALKEFTVTAAPEGSVEWTLNRAGIKNFIVDLRNTTKSEAIDQWLASPRPMRSIGLGFSRFENVFSRVNLKQTYDGLVFIETSTRARPNPTGLRDAWIIPEKTKTN
jgi:erythromycin esterase